MNCPSKKFYIVAGLAASLSFGTVLALPITALAEGSDTGAATAADEPLLSDSENGKNEKTASKAVGSYSNADSNGSASILEPAQNNQGDDIAKDGGDAAASPEGSTDDVPNVNVGNDGPASDDAGTNIANSESAAGELSTAASGNGSNELSVPSVSSSTATPAASPVLPTKGWVGDEYWDGSVDDSGNAKAFTGYVVDNHGDGRTLQRYWVSNGRLFRAGLFDSLDGFFGYSLKDGLVLRGRYSDEAGNVYLADNDGKLAGGDAGGWVVSAAYGQGLQRYWIDPATHAAKVGADYAADYEDLGNWAHYTTEEGFVLRGAAATSDGQMRFANNDGLLSKSGWLVTSAFGQGLQRYWLEGYSVAKDMFVDGAVSGWNAFAKSDGTIVRGAYRKGDLVYLADNEGKLAGGDAGGWVVSAAYGQGLQRYWIDPAAHAAKVGLDLAKNYIELGNWAHYTTDTGYVLRGSMDDGAGRVFLANNDGRLPEHTGWLVTAEYAGSIQRYYIDSETHAAVTGFFNVDGNRYFGNSGVGFVLRGATPYGDYVLLADNDGKMANAAGWLVTTAFGQGLQRYFMEGIASVGDYFGAKTGWFTVSGKDYFGKSTGFVSRNEALLHEGNWYITDNDGVAIKFAGGKIGWQNPSWCYQVSSKTVVLPWYASGYHTFVTDSRIAIDASRSDCIETFIGRAYEYLGTPYKWNYSSWPGDGVDCVGLVYQCAYACGMDMGEFNPYDHYATGSTGWHSHDANNLWDYGSLPHYGLGDRERGDVVSWAGHVAIYLGDDRIIEAYPGEVKISSLWAHGTPRGVIRFFN